MWDKLLTNGRQVAGIKPRFPGCSSFDKIGMGRAVDKQLNQSVGLGTLFEVDDFGELGRLRATDRSLEKERLDKPWRDIPLNLPSQSQSIDENFVAALSNGSPLCCSAEQALDTVRLLEPIARSAAMRQVVPVIRSIEKRRKEERATRFVDQLHRLEMFRINFVRRGIRPDFRDGGVHAKESFKVSLSACRPFR